MLRPPLSLAVSLTLCHHALLLLMLLMLRGPHPAIHYQVRICMAAAMLPLLLGPLLGLRLGCQKAAAAAVATKRWHGGRGGGVMPTCTWFAPSMAQHNARRAHCTRGRGHGAVAVAAATAR